MYFTTNHDEDGSGTSFERLKGAAKAFAVFSFTVPGMPLIYTGQETANTYKANFMTKEYVAFQNHDMTDFYTYLISLKDKNPALWNGSYGGDYKRLINGADSSVISFIRTKDNNKVLSLINFSEKVQSVSINSDELKGVFTDLFKDGYKLENLNGKYFVLEPFEYRLFSSNSK
jgi:cyclomaltodextrinase / maltogenic alpha-amylase / neopullulanase